jgi:hypothetical protein
VRQGKLGIVLKQTAYAKKLLRLAGMERCNSTQYLMDNKVHLTKQGDGDENDTTLYRSLIGSLRYLLHTWPDLSYLVGVVSRYIEEPKHSHLAAMKQIMRFIRGTVHDGLLYTRGGDCKLIGYTDSKFGTDMERSKGYVPCHVRSV